MFCPQAVDLEGLRLWIQTCAAVVAALGTVWTVWWTASRYLGERKTEQAKRVYAWIQQEGNTNQLRVGNRSELPVYNAFFYYMVRPDASEMNAWEDLEAQLQKQHPDPGDMATTGGVVPAVRVLPPGEFIVETVLQGLTGGRHDFSSLHGVDVVFTDASGKHWTRRARGKLEESSKNPLDTPRMKAVLGLFGMASTPWRRIASTDRPIDPVPQ